MKYIKLYIYSLGFMTGMCIEYAYRVDGAIILLPIFIAVLSFISAMILITQTKEDE